MKISHYTFNKNQSKDYFIPTVCGVGAIGTEMTKDGFGKEIDSYARWRGMIKRCYTSEYQERRPSYKGCRVCDEWLYYPTFKKWYDENYYEIDDARMELDKDVIKKGNKVYSPDNCVFVPQDINGLFVRSQASRGKYLIGVKKDKRSGKYEARCKYKGILVHLGTFESELKAFYAYKEYKEQIIKDIANEYRDKIPERLYYAMINYRVESTD